MFQWKSTNNKKTFQHINEDTNYKYKTNKHYLSFKHFTACSTKHFPLVSNKHWHYNLRPEAQTHHTI